MRWKFKAHGASAAVYAAAGGVSETLKDIVDIEMMLHPIIEEVWTTGVDPRPVRRARMRDARDGWDAACARARDLAADFDLSDFVHGEHYSYAWGRNKDSRKTYRFIVK